MTTAKRYTVTSALPYANGRFISDTSLGLIFLRIFMFAICDC